MAEKRKLSSAASHSTCVPCVPHIPPPDYDSRTTYSWGHFLDQNKSNPDAFVPPNKFIGGLLADEFKHMRPGLQIEVPNRDFDHMTSSTGGVYWVAEVKDIRGYRALLRYHGHDTAEKDFWMSLLSKDLHPVGWCADKSKPLVPPKDIENTKTDWKGYLVQRLTGGRTLPSDWSDRIKQSIASQSLLRKGMICEMIDKDQPSQVIPGQVTRVIGDRVLLEVVEKYKSTVHKKDDDTPTAPEQLVFSSRSPLLFPVGWAKRVGYTLHANDAYEKLCDKVIRDDPMGDGSNEKAYQGPNGEKLYTSKKEHNWFLIPKGQMHSDEDNGSGLTTGAISGEWQEGMKFECLDPFSQTEMHVATTTKVLKDDWLRVVFDGGNDDDDNTFPIHKRSPYIFPVGACKQHGIKLNPPENSGTDTFSWDAYLQQSNSVAAPKALFEKEIKHEASNAFKTGSKLESVDIREPNLICVASVSDVRAFRLIKIAFDGWGENYDQWQDYRSPEIKPTGWCESVGHKLESPANEAATPVVQPASKKKK